MTHKSENPGGQARASGGEDAEIKVTSEIAQPSPESQAHDRASIRAAMAERVKPFRAAEEPEPQAGGEHRRAFRLLTLEEVLREPCPTDWLLRDFLEAEALVMIFGASEAMKTFVALDMGMCIASGLPWHGHAAPRPGPVIYVCAEGQKLFSKRLQAWIVDKGIDTHRVPLRLASEAVRFLDPVSLKDATHAVTELAEQHGNPRLIIIDTLARCFGPGDENSTKDMGEFVAVLDCMKAQFGCAVLVVHHSGLNEKDRARGASALRAALDREYRLDVQDDVRILICTKSKDHERPADLAFEPETVNTGWTDPETGYSIDSVVLRKVDLPGKKEKSLTGAKRVALDALRELCEVEGRAHIEKWRAEAYRQGITASDDASAKRKAFSRAVSDLRKSGHIKTDDDFYWPAGQQDRAGQTGHVPPLSPCPERDGQGHTLIKGVPCPALGTLPESDGGEAA